MQMQNDNTIIDPEVRDRIISAFKEISLEHYINDISYLHRDLSPRRYFKVLLKNNCPISTTKGTIVVMYFDSVKPPEVGSDALKAGIAKNSFESFLEIGEFLQKNGVSVPKIYHSSVDLNIILMEDLGSSPLFTLISDTKVDHPNLYHKAVDNLYSFQNIKQDSEFFIFQRGFSESLYVNELNEFRDFILPDTINSTEKTIVDSFFSDIASEINNFKKALVHRDYHSWNIMYDFFGELRLIDYQDALMGTRSYDLVALVHERDIDTLLGEELVSKLEEHFFSLYNDSYLKEYEYPRVLLQRDMKVAGRFAKVLKTRGLTTYGAWIPGTVARIDSTLRALHPSMKKHKDFFDYVEQFLTKDYINEKVLS